MSGDQGGDRNLEISKLSGSVYTAGSVSRPQQPGARRVIVTWTWMLMANGPWRYFLDTKFLGNTPMGQPSHDRHLARGDASGNNTPLTMAIRFAECDRGTYDFQSATVANRSRWTVSRQRRHNSAGNAGAAEWLQSTNQGGFQPGERAPGMTIDRARGSNLEGGCESATRQLLRDSDAHNSINPSLSDSANVADHRSTARDLSAASPFRCWAKPRSAASNSTRPVWHWESAYANALDRKRPSSNSAVK